MTTADVARPLLRPEVFRRGPRLFATPADEPRSRRASDVVRLAGCSLALAAVSLAAVPAPGFSRAVSEFLSAFPDFLDGAWQILADLPVLPAVLLAVATFVRRRWSIARDLLFAVGAASVVWLVIGRLAEGSWPAMWDSLRAASPPPWYPSPRVALFGAIVMTASPHLTRPVRRFGGWLVVLGAFAVAALGATMPLGAVAGVLVAAIAAAAVHLAVGSSGGRPGLDVVQAALAELGVRTNWLGAADRQQAGLFIVNATDDQARRWWSRSTGVTPTTPHCCRRCGERSGTGKPARRCASAGCSRSSTRHSSPCTPGRPAS
ncbi:MAG: hypothetical protein ACRD07_06460 [Acidimicrobiales bacterium]